MIFSFFKKKTVLQLLLETIEEVAQENDARRVNDLLVSISADNSNDHDYLISITNTGRRTYNKLHITYSDILLWAESFGIDTTHMPSKDQYISGEPLFVDTLNPGKTIQVVCKGYGPHASYDGYRQRVIKLEYEIDNKMVRREDRSWCYAIVDLPNARTN